ncbi:MAG: DUF421 domain-containing protein [Symbiobacteriia bacterium]
MQNVLSELWHLSYRTIILYVVVLALVRLMGKRSLANMAPFDLVVILMIGEAAAIPIQEHGIPLIHGVLPVLLLAVLEFIVTWANVYSKWFEKLTQGQPRIMVRDGKLKFNNMKIEHVTEADLHSLLRDRGIDDVKAVREAWLEPNGTLSVIQTPNEQPMNLKQLRQEISKQDVERIIESKLAAFREDLLRSLEGLEGGPDQRLR